MTEAMYPPPASPSAHAPAYAPQPNLLTVDLEEWFHICEVEHLLPRERWDVLPSDLRAHTERLLRMMEGSRARATFFVVGYVAGRHPDLVRTIHQMGHEIAYHGWNHELVYKLSPDAFRAVLRNGVDRLGNVTGRRPVGYRAPQWSVNARSLWAPAILVEEGFLYDSSMAPLRLVGSEAYPREPHRLTTPAGHLWEFPPLTLKTALGNYPAGGSWGLRSLPYPLIRQKVRRLNRRRIPAVFYFHPREFGRNRSVRGLPLAKRFAVSARIWTCESRLQKLLADFRFTSMECYLRTPRRS